MAFNFSTFEIELSKKLSQTNDPYEILLISKAITLLKQNLIKLVATVSTLPALSTVSAGELYYVEADKVLYVADKTTFGGMWRPIEDLSKQQIWSWGSNSNGQLGDNTTTVRSSPVSVVGGFTDWCQISAGGHSLAIRTNGTLWAWGYNDQGRLGDNTIAAKSSPVSVVGGFTDWCQVSAGRSHTSAIRTNGTLWAWGSNLSGKLGDSTTVSKSSPVSVVGGFTDWCQVSAGWYHTAAVRTNGTLWAWGCNNSGQIGDSTTVSKSSPVSVVGGFTDWCQVSVGWVHSTAIRTNGTLWAWGDNLSGRLGDNTTVNKSSPVSVVGGFTDWCQVSVGCSHTAALRTNGTLWAWGAGICGQLGNNTIVSKSSPVSVVGGFTDWCQVSVGCNHTAALRTNGTLWSWGNNCSGKLGNGNGTAVSTSSPVSVVGGFTDWCQVSAGSSHTAAIRKVTF